MTDNDDNDEDDNNDDDNDDDDYNDDDDNDDNDFCLFFGFLCVSNVFFFRIFVSVHIVVLLILFTILNYMVTWFHIILKTNYNLNCPAF